MVQFISRNSTLLLIFALWFFVGSASIPLFFGLGTLTIFLFWRRGMYFEILLGFLFILILSDSLQSATDFAKDFKNIYILLLTAIVIVDRRHFSHINSIFKYFTPFIIISIIGLVSSPYIFTSFQKMLSYLLILFVVPQFFVKSLEGSGPIIVKDIIFFSVLLIIVGYLLRYVDYGLAFSHHGRFRSLFGNPNGLGIYTILLFGFAILSREYFKGLFSKTDMRWIIITILFAMIMSGSRTAIIAVGMFFVLSRFYSLSPFAGFLAFLTVAFGAELIANNLVNIVEALGLSTFFRVKTLDDGSGRYIAWNFAWQAIQDNFWFGRGFAYDEWLMGKNQDILNSLGHQGGVHNTYLIIWLNTGIAGLAFFLRGLFLLFIAGAKNCRLAFPYLWMILFSIMLEPWLAASLNPFTILLLFSITMVTDPLFQPYISGELNSYEKPDVQAVLV